MYSKDIEKFIEKNLSNFQLNGKGWNDLIRKMLFEFCIAGWDINKEVHGKEKFGGLRCYIILEDKDLEKKIQEIVKYYMCLSGETCEKCGGSGKERLENEWISTLCKKCFLEKANNIYLKKRSNLDECKICGYFALTEDICKFCGKSDYNTTSKIYNPKEYYESEIEYIKECQIEILLDEDDEIEFSKRTKGYSKSESLQILFTFEELKEYRKLNEEWKKLDNE